MDRRRLKFLLLGGGVLAAMGFLVWTGLGRRITGVSSGKGEPGQGLDISDRKNADRRPSRSSTAPT